MCVVRLKKWVFDSEFWSNIVLFGHINHPFVCQINGILREKKGGFSLLFQLKRLSLCNNSMPILCPFGWLMRRIGLSNERNMLREKRQT